MTPTLKSALETAAISYNNDHLFHLLNAISQNTHVESNIKGYNPRKEKNVAPIDSAILPVIVRLTSLGGDRKKVAIPKLTQVRHVNNNAEI